MALVPAKHQHESATGICVLTLLTLPPTFLPIPPLWVFTEPRAQVEFSESFSKLPFPLCFTYGS